MGLFDWLFTPKSKWIPVSENDLTGARPLTKSDTKATLRSYLKQCGFAGEEISDEIECYTDNMRCEEENLQEEIQTWKEDIKEAVSSLDQFKKTRKDESGKVLDGEDYEDELESLQDNVVNAEEVFKESQEELKTLKKDWTSFLIKHINDNANQED